MFSQEIFDRSTHRQNGHTMKTWTLVLTFAAALWVSSTAVAQQPTRSSRIITTNQEREAIRSQNILDRPYRIGHFYGNTVRRRHHRGTVTPVVRSRR
jgi:hypothetical protein